MKIVIACILALHGLIHLMGFAKAFNYATISQLTQPISKPIGSLWLLATLLFLVSLALFLLNKEGWWLIATAAIVLSQILIFKSWTDAKFGTLANVVILVPVIIALMGSLPSSFKNRYEAEVIKRLNNNETVSILTESDIAQLPLPVQRYLYFTDAVGKPKVYNSRSVFSGQMKQDKKEKWIPIHSKQYNFIREPARVFYIKSALFGIPFDGLHLFAEGNATMQIKLAHLLQVADAKGEKMNQSETVTIFNDMCLMAPATLIDKNIQWETVDSLTVKARFTNGANTLSATLLFDERGALINFISDDRYLSADGKKYERYTWSTPIKSYQNFNGRNVCSEADAIWHMPEGEFIYANFNLEAIEYNCTEFK